MRAIRVGGRSGQAGYLGAGCPWAEVEAGATHAADRGGVGSGRSQLRVYRHRLGVKVVLADAERPGPGHRGGRGHRLPLDIVPVRRPGLVRVRLCRGPALPGPGRRARLGEHDVGYRQVGALVLAGSPERQADITGQLLARRADAPEIGHVAALTGAQARELFPPLRPDLPAVSVGRRAPGGRAPLSPLPGPGRERRGELVMGGRGPSWWPRVRPRGRDQARRSGHRGGRGRRRGRRLDQGALLEPAGVTVPVEPQRGQIAHISRRPPTPAGGRWCLPSASRHYMLAFDDSGWSRALRARPGAASTTGSRRAAWPRSRRGPVRGARARRRVPTWRPGSGSAGEPGPAAAARPGGRLRRPGRRHRALGATGLTMGPYAGAIAARVALGEPPGADLAPFSPVRRAARAGPPWRRDGLLAGRGPGPLRNGTMRQWAVSGRAARAPRS